MTEQAQPVFSIEKIYVKDLSLEIPHAPQIYLELDNTKLNIEFSTNGKKIEDGIYEVSLIVNVSANVPDGRTVFLVEVAQAGIFQLRNIPESELEPVMMIGCANVLFPYARETVSDVLTRAGFQPVILQPVNFEALYQAQKQQSAASTDEQDQ
ncbi:MAG: protein-export chaperone SecB [Zoogloeaceae bacterium]|nr:protein-export chaperone SecB [Zoogloeaceae bacterium]